MHPGWTFNKGRAELEIRFARSSFRATIRFARSEQHDWRVGRPSRELWQAVFVMAGPRTTSDRYQIDLWEDRQKFSSQRRAMTHVESIVEAMGQIAAEYHAGQIKTA